MRVCHALRRSSEIVESFCKRTDLGSLPDPDLARDRYASCHLDGNRDDVWVVTSPPSTTAERAGKFGVTWTSE
ncbi:hypothetical protein LSAT2_000251 [Lamellibrachia satsuma]|nr:hypothetical protein LSAT2_000251 [Lamellibrachia satsuma]